MRRRNGVLGWGVAGPSLSLLVLLALPMLLLFLSLAQSQVSTGDNARPGTGKAAPVAPVPSPAVLSSDDTGKITENLFKKAIVRGKVTRTGRAKSGINFINFRNRDFVVVCFASDLQYFKAGEPADVYKDKTIEVSGIITKYKDQLQIKIFTPAQVKVVEASKDDAGETPVREKPGDETKNPTRPKKPEKPVDPGKFFKDR